MKIELLAPARNLECGREAVNHGADALYIGAPAFGARQAATNSIADIEALVNYAHLYGVKVFATVNTLLFDDELEPAVQMVRQLYNIGTDALIIQDMGLLQCDLPPIELHASTQCHNATVERIKFMESVGFRRVILARETSLEQMRSIREATSVELESFVHGALCVSYSGQCYMSQYLNQRSGNRGCCSQPCRSTYDLYHANRQPIAKKRHLLSLKDFNASQHLRSMIDAGISSFKIEGRLKDVNYVKNVTAHYRQLLDSLLEGTPDLHSRASSGRCQFFFQPDTERTFNRGYTDYFLRERHKMASLETQKSIGKPVGEVTTVGSYTLTVSGDEPFANGDGLCFLDSDGNMQGFLVNEVNGRTLTPNAMPPVKVGTPLWRNNDMQFERTLKGRTAERKIGVRMLFCVTRRGFSLDLTDEDGVSIVQHIASPHLPSDKPIHASNTIVKQLSKLGDSPFTPTEVSDTTGGRYFIATATLNELRRKAVDLLKEYRLKHFRPADCPRADAALPYPADRLDYRANIVNDKAEQFYKNHGIKELERGLEQTEDYADKALMTTKYCLRHELDCCLREGGANENLKITPDDTLLLRNNKRWFRTEFDCAECLMRIYAIPAGG